MRYLTCDELLPKLNGSNASMISAHSPFTFDASVNGLPIMANEAVVRRPKVVWPGLVRMGMHQKQIAGDGNCLFASLSDQLYGSPAKHTEIRASIIEHMRTLRPLFEHYVHKDDVQQRRALRSTTTAFRKEPDDAFEEYLLLMSRNGTYGGEPELVAFCQVYDQDVTVHLPQIQNFDRDSILYRNEHRETLPPGNSLHICYGGDEITRAHYDSARNRDGSHPRSYNSPLLEPQDSRRGSMAGLLSSSPTHSLSNRAIRNNRSDLSSELIHDLLQKGRRNMESSFDQLNDKHRTRSASVSSSHRSSSSKRSLEDDTDLVRLTKRADRRRSTRKRTEMATVTIEPDSDISFRLQIESPSAHTPNSTQDTEYSSETPDPDQSEHEDGDYKPPLGLEEASDSEMSRQSMNRRVKPSTRGGISIIPNREPSTKPAHPVAIAERPRSILRT